MNLNALWFLFGLSAWVAYQNPHALTGSAKKPAANQTCSCIISYNPVRWPTFVALRFVVNGRTLERRFPFIDTLVADEPFAGVHYRHPAQFRFGSLYFAFSDYNNQGGYEMPGRSLVQCVYGRDTMHLLLHPHQSRYTLVDNIPFRKGYFELFVNNRKLNRHIKTDEPKPIYFTSYFEQHQRELVQENPFTKCCFLPSNVQYSAEYRWVGNQGRYAPTTPGSIPSLMLAHMPFYPVEIDSLKPVANWWKTKSRN